LPAGSRSPLGRHRPVHGVETIPPFSGWGGGCEMTPPGDPQGDPPPGGVLADPPGPPPARQGRFLAINTPKSGYLGGSRKSCFRETPENRLVDFSVFFPGDTKKRGWGGSAGPMLGPPPEPQTYVKYSGVSFQFSRVLGVSAGVSFQRLQDPQFGVSFHCSAGVSFHCSAERQIGVSFQHLQECRFSTFAET